MSTKDKYQRVLLKISGEVLMGRGSYGIEPKEAERIAREIVEVNKSGIQVAIVIGSGNIFRGITGAAQGMDRATADYMGMLATVINALALQDAIEKQGVECRVQSSIEMRQVAEPFIRRRAIRHLEKGRVVVLAAGTGHPYFSTDTAAALRALELNCDVMLKATKVDGVYTCDPTKFKSAKKFSRLTHTEAIIKRVGCLDSSALTLCLDNKMPVVVFNLRKSGNIKKAAAGHPIGTLIA